MLLFFLDVEIIKFFMFNSTFKIRVILLFQRGTPCTAPTLVEKRQSVTCRTFSLVFKWIVCLPGPAAPLCTGEVVDVKCVCGQQRAALWSYSRTTLENCIVNSKVTQKVNCKD